jgi:hypothetical protein
VRTRFAFFWQTLDTKVKSLVNACVRQYTAGSVETRKAVLHVIRELIIVKQGMDGLMRCALRFPLLSCANGVSAACALLRVGQVVWRSICLL